MYKRQSRIPDTSKPLSTGDEREKVETDKAKEGVTSRVFFTQKDAIGVEAVSVVSLGGVTCQGREKLGESSVSVVSHALLGRYNVVNRRHLNMVLLEQELGMSGLTNEQSPGAKAGCVTSAEATILISYGCENDVEDFVAIEMTDCSTSEVLWTAIGYNASLDELLGEILTMLN